MAQHPALSEARVAVITGAASGIGLAAAKRFAAMGCEFALPISRAMPSNKLEWRSDLSHSAAPPTC
jgi:NAD(P)-dependent dehydrogenase (short-subunit alcohol dehydrogenase family)